MSVVVRSLSREGKDNSLKPAPELTGLPYFIEFVGPNNERPDEVQLVRCNMTGEIGPRYIPIDIETGQAYFRISF